MNTIKQTTKNKLASLSAVGVAAFAITTSYVTSIVTAAPADELRKGANQTEADGGTSVEGAITTITNVAFFLIGVVSVLMIIWSGFRYITSNGDASTVKSAKDTLLYSIVGLIVALLGYAIVAFVVNTFSN